MVLDSTVSWVYPATSVSESECTESGASADDNIDKTATVQYEPVTSLAGNNVHMHSHMATIKSLSNIHGLYWWRCNLFDVIHYSHFNLFPVHLYVLSYRDLMLCLI